MKGERIEVYPDKAGEWRWTHKAANNEKVADSGEGYATRDGAMDAAERQRRNTPEIPIYEVE